MSNNIVILTASHPFKAAGLVAFDLKKILNDSNHDVLIITNSSLEKKYPNTVSLQNKIGIPFISKVVRKTQKVLSKVFFRNTLQFNPDYHMNGIRPKSDKNSVKKLLKYLPKQVDAFIYLFPQKFLDATDLAYLHSLTGAPIFWYMMDMAPMTGGCHYAWDCLGYTQQCGNCPGIYSDDINDVTNRLWNIKKKSIASSNIIPVAASEWQYQQLQQSSLFVDCNKYKILIPVDSNLFKPGNRKEARLKLKLPHDKKVLFFGSVSVEDRRKGFIELVEALIILKSTLPEDMAKEVHIAIAGVKNSELDNVIPFKHTYLGYLNYEELASAYQAADLFVCPSIEDSGPMMINQSVLSGTPVVSFEMGIASDLVINNKTGFQVESKNCQQFATAIQQALTLADEDLQVMNDNCRDLGLRLTSCVSVGEKWKKMLDFELARKLDLSR